jgi:hypothetical protein
VTAALLALLPATAPAQTGNQATDEARFVTLINEARRQVAYGRIGVDAALASVARTWAGVMAANGAISHNPNLTTQVGVVWFRITENVGMGPSVDTVHQAFMQSPGHRANILDREINAVGVGVAYAGGRIFVVEVFAQLLIAPPLPSSPPAVPTGLAPGGNTLLRSPPPTVTATYSDPDDDPGHVYFVVVDAQGRTVREGWSPATASGRVAALTLSGLADGAYAVYALAWDGATSPWSAPSVFSLNRQPPAAPTGLALAPEQVSAAYHDPDGSPGYVHFWVVNAGGTVVREGWSTETRSGSRASLPALPFAPGTYTLYAVAFDGLASPVVGPVTAHLA